MGERKRCKGYFFLCNHFTDEETRRTKLCNPKMSKRTLRFTDCKKRFGCFPPTNSYLLCKPLSLASLTFATSASPPTSASSPTTLLHPPPPSTSPPTAAMTKGFPFSSNSTVLGIVGFPSSRVLLASSNAVEIKVESGKAQDAKRRLD